MKIIWYFHYENQKLVVSKWMLLMLNLIIRKNLLILFLKPFHGFELATIRSFLPQNSIAFLDNRFRYFRNSVYKILNLWSRNSETGNDCLDIQRMVYTYQSSHKGVKHLLDIGKRFLKKMIMYFYRAFDNLKLLIVVWL